MAPIDDDEEEEEKEEDEEEGGAPAAAGPPGEERKEEEDIALRCATHQAARTKRAMVEERKSRYATTHEERKNEVEEFLSQRKNTRLPPRGEFTAAVCR
jgi:hypothetical protein